MNWQNVQRVAHRGGSALAPENTLAAFQQALNWPVDAIELDVQMSADGHAVVFHDETMERLTDGRGNMLDLDLAYLHTLNAAAHFAGGWPDVQRIPSLREVLDVARAGGVQAYVEIKASKRLGGPYERYPHIAEAVVREIVASEMQTRVVVISFDWEILPRVKELAPEIATGAIVSREIWSTRDSLADLLARLTTLQCAWLNLDHQLFSAEMPAQVHAAGLQLGLWTVNDAQSLLRLARTEVDSLTSDRPDLFAALVEDPD